MELNKIAAAILLAGLIGMITGKVSTMLYYGAAAEHHGDGHEVARGYTIEGADAFAEGGAGAGSGGATQVLASIAPLMATADAAAGEEYFKKKCALCHNADQGGAHATGPNLWGVLGRVKGHAGGFGYSQALAGQEGTWGYEELNAFINKPKKYVPGTIMAFAGESKDVNRANLIAYLRQQGSASMPLPEVKAEAPAEAEAAAPAADAPKADAPAAEKKPAAAEAPATEKPKE